MVFNWKFNFIGKDIIKLNNEQNLLCITSLPQTTEHVSRDGCNVPVRASSLVRIQVKCPPPGQTSPPPVRRPVICPRRQTPPTQIPPPFVRRWIISKNARERKTYCHSLLYITASQLNAHMGWENFAIFDGNRRLSHKRYKIGSRC